MISLSITLLVLGRFGMSMVGTPTVQQNPELGGSEGDLREELLGHIQAPWEPMGPQELSLEGR